MESFLVKQGDVIVAGSDGLFDNLFDSNIVTVLKKVKRQTTGFDFESKASEELVKQSVDTGLDMGCKTPFSMGARKAGMRHNGGKLDDTTVVVSSVTVFAEVF